MTSDEFRQISDYVTLVREYNVRRDHYDTLLGIFRRQSSRDGGLGTFLLDEFEQLHRLHAEIMRLRQVLVAAQAAAYA